MSAFVYMYTCPILVGADFSSDNVSRHHRCVECEIERNMIFRSHLHVRFLKAGKNPDTIMFTTYRACDMFYV